MRSKIGTLCLLLSALPVLARETQLVRTMSTFGKVLRRGPTVALIYSLNKDELAETGLLDGTYEHSAAWRSVARADDMLSGLPPKNGHGESINFIRVNMARRDLGRLRRRYEMHGMSILLFVDGKLIDKPISVGTDFELSSLTTTNAWRMFENAQTTPPSLFKRGQWILGGLVAEYCALYLASFGGILFLLGGGVGTLVGFGVGVVSAGTFGGYWIYRGVSGSRS